MTRHKEVFFILLKTLSQRIQNLLKQFKKLESRRDALCTLEERERNREERTQEMIKIL